MNPLHPGHVDYFEQRHGKDTLVLTEKILNPDDKKHFFQNEHGAIPVVKVVAILDEEGFPQEIVEYGPHGERLRSTYSRLN